jgi:hypothetical protein
MSDENDRPISGLNRRFKGIHPFVERRLVPIRLFDPAKGRFMLFPKTLPVIRAGTAQTWDNKYGRVGGIAARHEALPSSGEQ